MNFFRSKLNQVKHFTPFHDMILALNNVIKAEETIIKGQSKAFGEELRRYANSQKEDFVAALIAVADAGQQQVKLQQEVNSQFTTLPRDLQPLLQQETEMHKWREIVFKAIDTAEKSRKEVEKAEAALNTSKARGNPADIAKKEAITGMYSGIAGGMFMPISSPVTVAERSGNVFFLSIRPSRYSDSRADATETRSTTRALSPNAYTPHRQEGSNAMMTKSMLLLMSIVVWT